MTERAHRPIGSRAAGRTRSAAVEEDGGTVAVMGGDTVDRAIVLTAPLGGVGPVVGGADIRGRGGAGDSGGGGLTASPAPRWEMRI